MSIVSSDLAYYLSSPEASAGNQQSQSDPSASLGGWLSSSIWFGGILNDLFEDLTGDDNSNLVVEYRCLFLVNRHATLTWTAPVIWIKTLTAGAAAIAIGIDPTAPSPVNTNVAPQALTVDSPLFSPPGVIFSSPTDKADGLAMGSLLPGYCKAFWVRRTAQNTAAAAPENCVLRAEGNSL